MAELHRLYDCRQFDHAPTPLSREPIPKGMARVLGAERVQREYREQMKKKRDEGGERKTVELLPGESLREFNRRVEDVHRPLVRDALKRGKGGKSQGKRKREEEEEQVQEERPVREFATVSSSAPKRLNQVALAPPVLTKGPRGSGVGKDGGKVPVSMARKVVLERERERAVELYRALKASKQTPDKLDKTHA